MSGRILRVVEVFSCSGGLAEGLRRAGLPVSIAFDWDNDACDSYEANHGKRPIRIDARDLLRLLELGWSPGEIDLAVFDPPCTPWSRAGRRLGIRDRRDMLLVTVELIRWLRPRAYLIANVPGLDDAPNWPVVQRTIGALASCGYCVRDFARLNAADYGVPQVRVRPFWYGHRGGSCIEWPARTHGPPTEAARAPLPGIAALRPWQTCRDALGHLSPEELGEPIRLRWKADSDHRASNVDEPAKTLTANTHSDGALLVLPDRADASRDSATVANQDGARDAHDMEWPWARPATTVARDERLPPSNHHGHVAYLSDGIKLSERAAAILQGFPEGWTFCGKTKRARWSQLGQAMPPALMEAVARSIARAVGSIQSESHERGFTRLGEVDTSGVSELVRNDPIEHGEVGP